MGRWSLCTTTIDLTLDPRRQAACRGTLVDVEWAVGRLPPFWPLPTSTPVIRTAERDPVIFSTDHSSNCDITSVRSGHSVNQPSRKLAFPARDSSENQPSIVQARRFKIDVPRLGNENVLEVVPIERRTLVPRPGHVH